MFVSRLHSHNDIGGLNCRTRAGKSRVLQIKFVVEHSLFQKRECYRMVGHRELSSNTVAMLTKQSGRRLPLFIKAGEAQGV